MKKFGHKRNFPILTLILDKGLIFVKYYFGNKFDNVMKCMCDF